MALNSRPATGKDIQFSWNGGATEATEGKEAGGEAQDHNGNFRMAAPNPSLIFSSDLLSLRVLRGSPLLWGTENPWRNGVEN